MLPISTTSAAAPTTQTTATPAAAPVTLTSAVVPATATTAATVTPVVAPITTPTPAAAPVAVTPATTTITSATTPAATEQAAALASATTRIASALQILAAPGATAITVTPATLAEATTRIASALQILVPNTQRETARAAREAAARAYAAGFQALNPNAVERNRLLYLRAANDTIRRAMESKLAAERTSVERAKSYAKSVVQTFAEKDRSEATENHHFYGYYNGTDAHRAACDTALEAALRAQGKVRIQYRLP